MNYRILFFTIGISLFLMGSVLFFVVSQGAQKASSEVLLQHQDRSLADPSVTKASFELGDPAYTTDPHPCSIPFQDNAYINLVAYYQHVPDSCTAFVNDRYVETFRDLQPECIGQCPYEEFSRTLPLGLLDVRDSHRVRVCCNDICIERPLPRLCSAPSVPHDIR